MMSGDNGYKVTRMSVLDLESGMVTAQNVTEPITDRILLFENTVLDSITIFNLKERYHVEYVAIKTALTPDEIPQRAEVDVHKSLDTLKDVFGSDSEAPISSLSPEAAQEIHDIADNIITSLYEDDNILVKMHQLQSFDDYTYKHCLRVAMMSAAIGKQLNLKDSVMRDLCEAALLHDIGKRMININIIRKPSKLTDAEFEEIKKHPQYGYYLLKKNGTYSNEVMNGVLMHQEKFDGTGYPLHLSGDKISLIARIITVADVYDALTSNRPYRKPWSVAEAEEFMMGGGGTHFDYDIIKAFLAAFAPYPVGAVVRLSDGRQGIVTDNNSNVLRPVVLVQNGSKKEFIDLYNDFKYLSLAITGIIKT